MQHRFVTALLSCSALTFANLSLAQPVSEQHPSDQTMHVDPSASRADTGNQTKSDSSTGAQFGEDSDSEITVTGTRIVRDGYTAPTPVTVASTEELIRTTPSSIPDALNKLPQFQNSLSPSRTPANFSNFPVHGNILNLRGLGLPGGNPKGPLRTLILFDGIRVPPTNFVGTVDTNALPEMLMQRVDVVTGGASAQWGSDAVAGVVNFALEKKFIGIKGIAQAGVAERGYGGNQRLGAAGGLSFADGRGHFLLSGDYLRNSGMRRNERSTGRQNYVFVGSNPASCSLAASRQSRTCAAAPGTATNPYVVRSDILVSALADSGRIVAASFPGVPAGSTPGTVSANPFVGQVINQGGRLSPFDLGTPVGTSNLQQGGSGFAIPSNTFAVTPSKSYQTFGRISYDLADNINVYAQGIFSRSDVHYITQANAISPPTQQVQIFRDNPYLPAAIAATLPTANDFITIGQYAAGQPQPVAQERTDFWMATAGVEGKVGRFTWSANFTHGSSTHELANSGLYESKKLYAAADVILVNGVPTCRVLTTPSASQFAGCTPVNFLQGNPALATPAGYAYVTGTSRYRARIEQDGIQANFSGTLLELPAGPVDIAIGAEWRNQKLNLTSNADPALLDTPAERNAFFTPDLRGVPPGASFFWLTNVGGARGTVNVKEAYGEVAVPILNGAPGFKELSINGAARITDYSTSGMVTTWKAGVLWRPVDDLLLRTNLSRDIRAPNLFELFAGAQGGISMVIDPVSGTNQAGIPSIASGNPNLNPEAAKTLTLGGVFTPSFIRGFSLSIDYYRIRVDGMIESLGLQSIVNNCFNSGGAAPECNQIDRDTPTSPPTLIRLVPNNIAFLKTEGIDFDASYRAPLFGGNLSVRLYANHLRKFDAQQATGAPISRYAGISVVGSNPAGYPKWRGNLTLDYTTGPFGVTISQQYIHKMRLDIPGGPLPIRFVDADVPAVWYTDLSARVKVPSFRADSEFFLTINNLFDKDPPLIPGTIPGVNLPTNIAVYDITGRAFTAGVRFKF